ncbi:MAG: efflux RND transporter periplasmic adaptor subunit [Chloroflexi bacterium]|nr:efflux RND transporter periplasmic adaptor subunit [Chloroflexota bacterium]
MNARLVGMLCVIVLLALQVVGCNAAAPNEKRADQSTASARPAEAKVSNSVQASGDDRGAGVGGKAQGTPLKDDRAAMLTYTGDVKPKAQVILSPKGIGRIEALGVEVGSVVRAGDTIGHLDRASIEAQLKQVEAAVAVARAKLAQMEAGSRTETIAQSEANLDSLREKLAAAQDGGRKETVAQAAAGLRAAEARLAQLKAGPTAEQIDQAETAVRVAKNQLYAVQTQADAYLGSRAVAFGQLIFTEAMKEAQAGAAWEQIKLAEARLAELKAGATREQLDQATAAVDQATAALEMAMNPLTDHDLNQIENAVAAAEAQVKLARNPFTKADFDVADASVAQAQASVDLVMAQLAETNIIAPISGVVSEKFLSVGALASPQTPILTIISSDLEIVLSVEEARSGQIRTGQPVSFSVAAYPDRTFAGAISSVAPAIDPRSRTFTVKVTPKDSGGDLKAGMFARVSINAGE